MSAMRRARPTSSDAPSPRPPRRRWRVPPALIRGTEAFEGAQILEEFPDSLGLTLWQALRDVGLWTAVAAEERGDLFAEGAERALSAAAHEELAKPLETIVALVRSPGLARADRVKAACRRISDWADARGTLGTALAFMQAAALAEPTDADAAYKVGRFARRRAEYARAESWFRQTITLARQGGDWASYSLAFLGLGKLYMQRGNFPAARRFFIRALRAAKRHSLRELQGMALHDLACVASENDDAPEVARRVRASMEAYGPRSPELRRLAYDVAVFWLYRGHFARALPVFQAVLPHFTRHWERALTWGNIARAAAGVGDRATWEEAWKKGWELADDPYAQEAVARALLGMAHGAHSMGEWDRAEQAAERALRLATERGEAKIQFAAESLLGAVRQRRASAPVQGAAVEEAAEEADSLAHELVHHLASTGR
ncbi:MAG: tetratricopeptide repeat protein [Gemmatimonadota bacterium]|jgi:tetratricopeptide (TPR) repeat protein|nr:tetratricopeptide repeat protein [Gemmatimonadota bacterium]